MIERFSQSVIKKSGRRIEGKFGELMQNKFIIQAIKEYFGSIS